MYLPIPTSLNSKIVCRVTTQCLVIKIDHSLFSPCIALFSWSSIQSFQSSHVSLRTETGIHSILIMSYSRNTRGNAQATVADGGTEGTGGISFRWCWHQLCSSNHTVHPADPAPLSIQRCHCNGVVRASSESLLTNDDSWQQTVMPRHNITRKTT